MGKVDVRLCASLEEIFQYAEDGAIEGCSPEFARYISQNFDLIPEPTYAEELEEACQKVDDLEDALRDIRDRVAEAIT